LTGGGEEVWKSVVERWRRWRRDGGGRRCEVDEMVVFDTVEWVRIDGR